MANQVAARLSGDDYQHLYTWFCALELKMPQKQVQQITVEDESAGSVDDVTVLHKAEARVPDRFYQVKYHVDHRDQYSTELILASKQGSSSLLEKFWRTWQLLEKQAPSKSVVLHLVSNWTWDASDKFCSCICGRDNSIKEAFFVSSSRSELGRIRRAWQEALNASDKDFQRFVSCLRFKLGFDCSQELEIRVAERMNFMGLKSDETALLIAVGIVRNWITSGKQILVLEEFEKMLNEHNLYYLNDHEKSVNIYLSTIKSQKFNISPDYELDWCKYFTGDEYKKGHQLIDHSAWNTQLLPELNALEARVNTETDCRLVRVRGLARLSAWFAFGFAFSEVARYIVEVDQQGQQWRTDASPSLDFALTTSTESYLDGEILDGEGETVAVGLSVTGLLNDDVRDYLSQRTEKIASVLFLRPERDLGHDCLRNAHDATALANQFKTHTRSFVKKWRAKRLLLFYYGPLSGACFVGHRLNAICQNIQIMEDQQPGYAPSFKLD